MITLPPSVRIYLCATLIDGRRGIDSLSAMVRSTLDVDPFSGHLFVFLASHGRGVRILFWDRNGFALYLKRLEKGRFHLPREIPGGTASVTLDPADLAMLLEGIDLRGATRRPRWEPTSEALAVT
jgi:transposase